MQKIIIYGKASKKIIYEGLIPIETEINLLLYLRSLDIPIASSCNGERICHKCVVNTNILACSITLKTFLTSHNRIEIDYL